MDHQVDSLGKRIPDGGNSVCKETVKLLVTFGELPEMERVSLHMCACVHVEQWEVKSLPLNCAEPIVEPL